MEILVFKTNVTCRKKIMTLAPLLSTLPTIRQFNFNLEDRDKILCIESTELNPASVEALLLGAGFDCRELDY